MSSTKSSRERAFLVGERVLAVAIVASACVFGISWVVAVLQGEGDLTELALSGLGFFLAGVIRADLRKGQRRERQIRELRPEPDE